MHGHKNYKFLSCFFVLMPTMLILSNIFAMKLIQFWSGFQIGPLSIPAFVISGGTLLFPITYLCGDIVTEVYGEKNAKKLIWSGFYMLFFMQFFIWMVGALPSAPTWHNQAAYDAIFGQAWRINVGSLLSFLAGERVNAKIVSWMKPKDGNENKGMGFRFVASTVAGQFVDSMIFLPIAFAGIIDNEVLFAMFLSNWIFKVLWEVLALPITIPVVKWFKRIVHGTHMQPKSNLPQAMREAVEAALAVYQVDLLESRYSSMLVIAIEGEDIDSDNPELVDLITRISGTKTVYFVTDKKAK